MNQKGIEEVKEMKELVNKRKGNSLHQVVDNPG